MEAASKKVANSAYDTQGKDKAQSLDEIGNCVKTLRKVKENCICPKPAIGFRSDVMNGGRQLGFARHVISEFMLKKRLRKGPVA